MKHRIQPIAYFTLAFTLGSIGYLSLAAVLRPWPVFAGPFRMFMYHEHHPYQYIALVSAVYAILATTWALTIGWRQTGVLRWLAIAAIIPLTIVIASFPGGMLWSWHDMQAGFVPVYWRRKLAEEGLMGLQIGWFVICLSFPYNVAGIVAGLFVTDKIEKKLRRTTGGTVRR